MWSAVPIALVALAGCDHSNKNATATSTTKKATAHKIVSTTAALSGPTSTKCTPPSTTTGANGGTDYSPPGDIPDNQSFITYAGAGFKVDVPEGWARSEVNGEVNFTDKLNTVNVRVLSVPASPTIASVTKSEVPQLSKSIACVGEVKVSTLDRTAGSAILLTYQTDAPLDPVTGKIVRDDVERYEFWQNGKEAVITLSGAAGSDNVDPWKRVTDSFAWTK